MRIAILLFAFGIINAQLSLIHADDLDPASKEALEKTQHLLKDRKARESSISKDAGGSQADNFTKKLTGNAELTDEVYTLAADVFSIVVKDANGDVTKMKEAMDKFSRDPASFADKWSPEQKAKLKNLSEKLPQPILKN